MTDPRTLDLVPLSTIPQDQWIGRHVYHPSLQSVEGVFWHTSDYTDDLKYLLDEEEIDCFTYDYDEGIVLSWFYQEGEGYENWPREDLLRVRFGDGSWAGLHYGPDNLWTLRTGD